MTQVFDADLLSGCEHTAFFYRQIVLMSNGNEPQRANVLHRPNEAKIDLPAFEVTDDVVGGAARNMQLDLRILPGNACQECRQQTHGGGV
jgi:hypothetical protein